MTTIAFILAVLKSKCTIVWSWGAHNYTKLDENTLRFNVQGFLLCGVVEIKYNEGSDLFDIRTWDKLGAPQKNENDVYADQLVDVIDAMVEKCENYEERVKQEYSK